MSLIVKRNNGINLTQAISWSSNRHHTLDGYQMLAIEVVRGVAEDYREELIRCKQYQVKTPYCCELEKFFLSDYGQVLSMGTGKYIMEKIRKEVGYAEE
jgi:hypothetical protein